MLASGINYLRNHSTIDVFFRELTANNLPRIAIVRNMDEAVDVAITQFGNMASFNGTGFLVQGLIDKMTPSLQKNLSDQGKEWFRLGKSFSIFSMIGAMMYGISFLRNYITTKRTGTTDYAQMIGEKDRQNMDPNYVQEVAEGNLKHYLKAAGAGALLSATIMLSTIAIAKKGIAMPKILRWIQSKTSLLEGKFSKAPIPAIILFGVLPAYAGFIDGARDIYEKKEIALRFAGYITSFHLLPKLIENAIGKGLKPRKITRVLGGPQNLAYVGKFLSTLIFSSSMPAILNIYLTRQRVKRDIAKSNLSPLFGDSSTYHPLKRHPILFTRQPLPIY